MFESEFLGWDEFRQLNFISLMMMTDKRDPELISQLLALIHQCNPPVVDSFIAFLMSRWPVDEPSVLDYIAQHTHIPAVRILLLIQITDPIYLTDKTLESVINLYMNPKDTVIEPVVESLVNSQPVIVLPAIISRVLVQDTQLRAQQLLRLIGRETMISVLGDPKHWPKELVAVTRSIGYNRKI